MLIFHPLSLFVYDYLTTYPKFIIETEKETYLLRFILLPVIGLVILIFNLQTAGLKAGPGMATCWDSLCSWPPGWPMAPAASHFCVWLLGWPTGKGGEQHWSWLHLSGYADDDREEHQAKQRETSLRSMKGLGGWRAVSLKVGGAYGAGQLSIDLTMQWLSPQIVSMHQLL